jgi:hypothetical protein
LLRCCREERGGAGQGLSGGREKGRKTD